MSFACPTCSSPTGVIDSRAMMVAGLRRRRLCMGCKLRFTTHETLHVPRPKKAKQQKETEGIHAFCS